MAIHELFACLRVSDTAPAIDFYTRVFGVSEKFRLVEPSGRIGHAELDFGTSTLMLSDEFPEYGLLAPQPGAARSTNLHLHVDNCDEVIARAIEAGATLDMAAQDQFYGERSGSFIDPFGHRWNVGHAIEEISTQEMQRRYTALMTPPAG
jgi:PhnB protein